MCINTLPCKHVKMRNICVSFLLQMHERWGSMIDVALDHVTTTSGTRRIIKRNNVKGKHKWNKFPALSNPAMRKEWETMIQKGRKGFSAAD